MAYSHSLYYVLASCRTFLYISAEIVAEMVTVSMFYINIYEIRNLCEATFSVLYNI